MRNKFSALSFAQLLEIEERRSDSLEALLYNAEAKIRELEAELDSDPDGIRARKRRAAKTAALVADRSPRVPLMKRP